LGKPSKVEFADDDNHYFHKSDGNSVSEINIRQGFIRCPVAS